LAALSKIKRCSTICRHSTKARTSSRISFPEKRKNDSSSTSIADIMTAHDAAAKAVKEVEQRMSDLSLLIKHTTTYRQLKPIYDEYRKSPDKEKYLRGHESEIILFEAAARALKETQIKKLPDLAALRKEYRSLNDRKTKLYEDY